MKRPESILLSSLNKIAIIWSIYLLIRGYMFLLPQRELSFMSHVITSLAFLCGLICYYIYREKGAPKPFFIIFGLYFFINSFSFITLFIDPNGIIGTLYDSWVVYITIFVLVDLLVSLSVTYLAIHFTLRDLSTLKIFLISFSISIGALLFNFQEIIFSSHNMIMSGDPTSLWWASIKLHFFWFAMLLLYWYRSIKSDKPLGQYINSIVFGISLYIPMDLLHMYSLAYKFDALNGINQYWNLLITCFFLLLLALKLYSVSNVYGKWYERILIFGDAHFGRSRGNFDRFIYWLLFSEKKNTK